MAKEVKKPKEELAPAYFVQYSALWCILLGFFVLLLSLGESQTGPGDAGVGAVRDAFGQSGGMGLLAFTKNAFGAQSSSEASLRIVRSEDRTRYPMEGFIRGMLSEKGLSELSLWMIEEIPGRPKVVIGLPVLFRDDMNLDPESIRMLELLGEVIFHLTDHPMECMTCFEGSDDSGMDLKRSMVRSAVVARFLSETCALPSGVIQAVGYYDNRFFESNGMGSVKGKVLLTIQ